jgi:nucleotide-binding universal stress UspA family protein
VTTTAPTSPRIVVGTDGSDRAATAVRWAADEAVRRDAALDVIHAWLPPYPVLPTDLYADHDAAQRAAEALVRATVRRLRREVPGLAEIHGSAPMDHPTPALLAAAMGAELLVVGSRGRAGLAVLLGSVSERCLAHAPCSVAIVPTPTPSIIQAQVVVGVDGSPSSEAALAWAAREAGLRGARLDVVHASATSNATSCDDASLVEDPGRLQLASRALLEDMVEGLADERGGGPPELLLQSVAGPAAEALMQRAAHAELLVVGAGGGGGLWALLGSVSRQCARHALCPTVVVRGVPTREPAMATAASGAHQS